MQSALAVRWALVEETVPHDRFAWVAAWCLDALRKGGKFVFAGNGGSFTDPRQLVVFSLRTEHSQNWNILLEYISCKQVESAYCNGATP